MLELFGDARVVLIGEASHGTHELYRMRAALTKRLIVRGCSSAPRAGSAAKRPRRIRPACECC